ncbi:uncharacterized protein YbjT (DUF2867 family) [Rhizobium mongolense]|uniref:Uncharacterized protein YbjT (DUF2867 family) n=1 Tax=Rhizobium mongolense TaxID=57676 RepID=A0ABR6IMP6_9HYPH|nr:uncharacterized protein YbjT (DUF2867 family) [Rhizobium mongolense]
MNVLILGATGFIGSAVAARLVADGHAVSGPGRRENGPMSAGCVPISPT